MTIIKDKDEVYEKAGMGGKTGFGKKCAIVVVDFQQRYTTPHIDGGDMSKECAAARELIDCARKKNIKIFYSYFGFRPGLEDLPPAWSAKGETLKTLIAGTPGESDIDERLEVKQEDVVFCKQRASVFFSTNLNDMLRGLGVDTVIMCGCTVAGCLYASVVDSVSYGYHTILCDEACADRSKEIRDIFMWNMGQKYADIYSLGALCKIIDEMNVQ